MALLIKTISTLAEDPTVHPSTHIWWLTTTCNSRSQESDSIPACAGTYADITSTQRDRHADMTSIQRDGHADMTSTQRDRRSDMTSTQRDGRADTGKHT